MGEQNCSASPLSGGENFVRPLDATTAGVIASCLELHRRFFSIRPYSSRTESTFYRNRSARAFLRIRGIPSPQTRLLTQWLLQQRGPLSSLLKPQPPSSLLFQLRRELLLARLLSQYC